MLLSILKSNHNKAQYILWIAMLRPMLNGSTRAAIDFWPGELYRSENPQGLLNASLGGSGGSRLCLLLYLVVLMQKAAPAFGDVKYATTAVERSESEKEH